jgi:hypothetical protein
MVTLADTVSIAITAVNDAPVAVADAFTISAATLVVSAPGVLANDADLDGPSLSAELVQPPCDSTHNVAERGRISWPRKG